MVLLFRLWLILINVPLNKSLTLWTQMNFIKLIKCLLKQLVSPELILQKQGENLCNHNFINYLFVNKCKDYINISDYFL